MEKLMTDYSRNQAQKAIAESTDVEFIARFTEHRNTQIRRYAAHKMARLNGTLPEAESLENPLLTLQDAFQSEPPAAVAEPVETAYTTVSETVEELKSAPEVQPAEVSDELAELVKRFTAEGKKNPLASARASMAARRQAEQKRAAKAASAA